MRILQIIFWAILLFFGGLSFQKKSTPLPPKKSSTHSAPATTSAPPDTANRPFQLPQKIEWLEITAEKNDQLATLLQRYGLYDFECNHRKFTQINQLSAGLKIIPGKKYKLPILVVSYNGKSIRTTLKTEDLDLAKRIKKFNEEARVQKNRTDDFIQSKKLWVAWNEYDCPAEGEAQAAALEKKDRPLPDIGKENAYAGDRIFPIFGKKYEKTPLESQQLKGKIFYIIAGHGGPDPGAQGKRNGKTLCEDEYAYDVSLRLTRHLVAHGATAFMIVRDPDDGIRDDEILKCDSDERVWGNLEIPREQKKRLFQRSDLVNAMTAQYLKKGLKDQTIIEIHVDSRGSQARADVFFYFRPGSTASEKLAKKLHNNFYQKYLKVRAQRKYTGTVTARDLHTLRETKAEKAVYIELANIRNVYDQQRLVLPENRQALSNWILEVLKEKG